MTKQDVIYNFLEDLFTQIRVTKNDHQMIVQFNDIKWYFYRNLDPVITSYSLRNRIRSSLLIFIQHSYDDTNFIIIIDHKIDEHLNQIIRYDQGTSIE